MTRLKLAICVALLGGVVTTAAAVAGGGGSAKARLTGFEEVPAILTSGQGRFTAQINRSAQEIRFRLTYSGLEGGPAEQAHIHVGQRGVNGGIAVWLCGSAAHPGPAGTPDCPAGPSGTVTGTIRPANVVGPDTQGVAPGEFAELVRAIRAGVTYANVHSTKYGGGEIRGQIGRRGNGDNHDHRGNGDDDDHRGNGGNGGNGDHRGNGGNGGNDDD